MYLRVSTEDQVKEGFSLEGQKDRLLNYCRIMNYDVYGIYIEEGISGKRLKNRPQINALIRDAKKKAFDAVIVFKLDRLGRNAREILEVHDLLIDNNIIIISLSENVDTRTAQGKMYFTILAAIAEMELATIVERTTLGKETKVKKGKYLNGPRTLFGYEYVDDMLKPVPHEAEMVRNMFRWIKEGASIREVTRRFIKSGIRNYTGSTNWDKSTINKMLKNPTYAGYQRYRSKRNGEIIVLSENIEPIISKEEFDDVQLILEARKSKGTKKYARTSYYFADVIYCAECGAKMVTSATLSRNGELRKHYQYYRCTRKYLVDGHIKRCEKSISLSQLKLMKMFWDYIENISLPKPNEDLEEEIRNWDYEIYEIEREIDKNKKRKDSLLKKFLDDLVPQDIYKTTLDELIKEYETLEQTKISLLEQKNNFEKKKNRPIFDSLINSIKDFKSSFEKLPDDKKRFFITKTIKKMYVSADKIVSIEFH